jgi:hypothetical protein
LTGCVLEKSIEMARHSPSEALIEKSFYLSVWIIEQLRGTGQLKEKLEELDKFTEGTLGKEIATCLKDSNLRLVPGYESHDMKHSLLNFKMTPLDEIRMQAFMLGNGNWSIPSIAIFLYGAILLPGKLPQFIKDFMEGRRAAPIKEWKLDEFAHSELQDIRESIFNQRMYKSGTIWDLSKYGSFAMICAGFFGMLFCYPYLWSSNISDLVGAGFPFVAGAILLVGGLINLSILSRRVELCEAHQRPTANS